MLKARTPTRRELLLMLLLSCLVLFKYDSNLASVPAPSKPMAVPHTLTGNFRVHKNFHSRFLSPDRDLIVYLPPGYEQEPTRRYPVLYMQDGQNLFDAATSFFFGMERHLDEKAQALIVRGAIRPLIIVGIYSNGLDRINEYTPTRLPVMNQGGEADLYGRMLVEEIKPFIDTQYRTLPKPSNTGLGGSSLGGLVTVYLGLKYANTFGKLAVSSPACYWDDEMIVRYVHSLPAKNHQRIWLAVGTGEPDTFVSSTRSLHKELVAKGWKEGIDLGYMEAAGARHNPEDWSQLVDRLLTFLFQSSRRVG
jgi:predicted alpha/beta superfamily hydrolase